MNIMKDLAGTFCDTINECPKDLQMIERTVREKTQLVQPLECFQQQEKRGDVAACVGRQEGPHFL